LWRRLQLNLPLQDARLASGGLCFRHMPGILQSDGERRVRQRIARRESFESQGRGNSLFALAGVAQGANQPMARLGVGRIGVNDRAKRASRRGRATGSEQVKSTLKQRCGICVVGHG